ncbi:MAG: hypothetical protein VKL41_14145 [Snowella sp.]|nr:hypothetical protein [Snowella sp.]
MTTPQELLKKTTCYVNGQTKDGRVLAVASYIDKRMVCFLFEGKTYCDWIPEASLFENKIVISSRDQDKEKSKGESQENRNILDISNKENTKKTDEYSTVKSLKGRNPRKEAKNDLQGIIDLLIKNPVKLLDQHVAATSQAINELNQEVNKIVKGSEETTIRLAEDTHKALVKSISDTTESVTKITADTHATVIRFIGDTCATTIQLTETTTAAIIRFPNDAYLTIYGQTEASTKILVKIFEDVQNSINYGANLVIALTDAEIRSRLNEIFITVNAVIKSILASVTDQWNRYWKERILNAIEGKELNLKSAKKIVDLLKQDFPNESSRNIANRLIHEKSVFATIISLVNAISVHGVPLGKILSEVDEKIEEVNSILEIFKLNKINVKVNILNMNDLIVEIIHQIAYVYGFNDFLKSDILVIYTLVFANPVLQILGLNFLENNMDLSGVELYEIAPILNFILLLVIGNTTCDYCEQKLNQINRFISSKEWKILEANIIEYTEEIISKKEQLESSLEKSLVQMLPMQK